MGDKEKIKNAGDAIPKRFSGDTSQLLFPHLKTDFCDTIETKAVVVISLDSRANRPKKPKT